MWVRFRATRVANDQHGPVLFAELARQVQEFLFCDESHFGQICQLDTMNEHRQGGDLLMININESFLNALRIFFTDCKIIGGISPIQEDQYFIY